MEGRPEGEDGEGKKERKAFFFGIGKILQRLQMQSEQRNTLVEPVGENEQGGEQEPG